MSDGFTLLEILLSIALIAVLAGISLPVSQQFQQRSDLSRTATTIAQTLHRAQVLAQSSDHDSAWGVGVDPANSNAIVLFSGTSFTSRDQALDETTDMSDTISVSGTGEVVFQKFSGVPAFPSSMTLTQTNGQSITIAINEKGTITY